MTAQIEDALARAEGSLDQGRGLEGTGFWRAVRAVRGDRELTERYADRIAVIDRRAFVAGVKARVPIGIGVGGLVVVTSVGVLLAWFSVHTGGRPPASGPLAPQGGIDLRRLRGAVPASFLLGLGALILGTHSLAHWLIGRLVGIRFTHVFLGGPKPPRPGVKTDYASYLRTSPRRRALMHGSGAVVTKLVPFALLVLSLQIYDGWPWLTWLLIAVGFVQIGTDVLLSTKSSDWMKVKRELAAGRGG